MTLSHFAGRQLGMLLGCLICVAAAGVVGCGEEGEATHPVSGKVTFDGTPVQRGSLSFIPENPEHRTASAKIADGEYSLRAPAGPHRIEIMATRDNGPFDPAMGQAPQKQYIPDKYNVASQLEEVVVDGGENRFDFELAP